MSAPAITVSEGTSAPEVARLMEDRNIGAVIVVDREGQLAGLITESDFTGIGRVVPFSLRLAPVIFGARPGSLAELQEIYQRASKLDAAAVMTGDVRSVSEDAPVGEVIHAMLQSDLKHVPVVRAAGAGRRGTPVGMIARHDVLKLAAGKLARG
ncbi:MAG: CBS domain-containing protein [Deltaproteobacteria bacterium]|nr:CBS domain-containing protein [Deltaproteobacteria bacterium]